jgi:hypothetical protein
MTTVLHLPPRIDAPVACDMSTAQDTPDERFADYGRLFERALLRRERRAGGVVLTFGADGGTCEAVEDLARREAACCPFLDYRIEAVGDEVIWTVSDPTAGADRAGVDVILDALYALPDHAGSGFEGYLGRLADAGLEVVEAGGDRFEIGSSRTG